MIVGFQSGANKRDRVELYRLITNFTASAACGKPMRDLGDFLDYIAADI